MSGGKNGAYEMEDWLKEIHDRVEKYHNYYALGKTRKHIQLMNSIQTVFVIIHHINQ